VTEAALVTVRDVTVKLAVETPAGMVTLAGTVATVESLLDRVTIAPPLGAALVSVAVPWALLPPVTFEGLNDSEDKLAGAGVPDVACGVNRREADQAPATPAEFLARTLHQCRTDARPVTVVCELAEVRLRTSGVVKLLLSST
jgi:hypothetical protein